MDNENLKYACQCNKCNGVFDIENAVPKETESGGVSVEYKVCPYCGSEGFTMLNHISFLHRIWINHEHEKRRWNLEI